MKASSRGKIAPVFLWPLLTMALGYMLLFAALWMVRIRTEIVDRRARSLMQGGSGMSNFFAMGGYAAFIWPAYGVSLWRCWR